MKKLLWEPSYERKINTNMFSFIKYINNKYNINLANYNELYQWSIKKVVDFWVAVWEFCDIKVSKPYKNVVINYENMIKSQWFPEAQLNFAENLLRYQDDKDALVFIGEGHEPVRISYAELYDRVARLARTMRDMGVNVGDRVAGFMPNMPETVISMLATTSIGAIWSSCSPDFGIQSILDRFGQIQPRVIFTANGYCYNGKVYDSLERVAEILKHIPSIEQVVVIPYTDKNPDISGLPKAVLFYDFLSQKNGLEIEFTQLPFNHPLYIMYSSGTTGVPKCIVHGAGGTLIQQLKELVLHTDLKRKDTLFYYTTCGWMMWNWMVSSLAVGVTLLLYDGSPFYPSPEALFKIVQDEKASIFGTSAKYLSVIEKEGVKPKEFFDLSSLKSILSTGSPLSLESFEYVYRDIKQDICLSSISGGTDIISCFALGNPIGPVYAGELQCRGLGMKVYAFDSNGNAVINQKGELVCTMTFPSMPIHFLNDPNGEKFKMAYFNVYSNKWYHGDFIEITDTGGVIIYGRSDTTLNPGGIRIGTAEIYRQVESLQEIKDSLVVGQDCDNDIRIILFVKLDKGMELNEELVKKIKNVILLNTTPRHVPSKIISVQDIPYTISGKKVELAVRNIIHNKPVKNRDVLANPTALDLYKDIQELNY